MPASCGLAGCGLTNVLCTVDLDGFVGVADLVLYKELSRLSSSVTLQLDNFASVLIAEDGTVCVEHLE